MKNRFFVLATYLVVMSLVFASCKKTPDEPGLTLVTDISVEPASLPGLRFAEPVTIVPAFFPANHDEPASDLVLKWESDSAGVATVDANGTVTATGFGWTYITVRLEKRPSVYMTIPVVVSQIPVQSFEVSEEFQSMVMEPGSKRQVTISLMPENYNVLSAPLHWSSSDTNVATVTQSGKISAVATGRTAITVALRTDWKVKQELELMVYPSWVVGLEGNLLDRSKYRRWDTEGLRYAEMDPEFKIENLWSNTGNFVYPFMSFTFDLGQTAILTKIRTRQAMEWYYTYYNVRRFRLWGSPHPNVTGNNNTWIFLGEYESIKPSGLPGTESTQADRDYAHAGEEMIIMPVHRTPVRYIRFDPLELWRAEPQSAVSIRELWFYGITQ